MRIKVAIVTLLIGVIGCILGVAALLEAFRLTVENPEADAADFSKAVSNVLTRYGWYFPLTIGSLVSLAWGLIARRRKFQSGKGNVGSNNAVVTAPAAVPPPDDAPSR